MLLPQHPIIGVGKYLGAAGATTLPRTAAASAGAQAASGGSTQGRKKTGGAGGGASAAAADAIDWADPAIDAAPPAAARTKGKGKKTAQGFADFSGW